MADDDDAFVHLDFLAFDEHSSSDDAADEPDTFLATAFAWARWLRFADGPCEVHWRTAAVSARSCSAAVASPSVFGDALKISGARQLREICSGLFWLCSPPTGSPGTRSSHCSLRYTLRYRREKPAVEN